MSGQNCLKFVDIRGGASNAGTVRMSSTRLEGSGIGVQRTATPLTSPIAMPTIVPSSAMPYAADQLKSGPSCSTT